MAIFASDLNRVTIGNWFLHVCCIKPLLFWRTILALHLFFPLPKRKIINCQSALSFPIVLSSLELTFSAFNLVLHCTFIKFRVTYATESYALMMYVNLHFPYIGFYSSWIDLHLLSLWFSCPFCKLCAAFPYVFSPTPTSSFPRNNWTGGEEEKVSLMLHLVEEGLSNAKDITCYGAQPGCVG